MAIRARDFLPHLIPSFNNGVDPTTIRVAAAPNIPLTSSLSKLNPAKVLTIGPGNGIPLIYGKQEVSGQIIQIVSRDKPLLNRQQITMLVALGYGPINKIGDVFITDPAIDRDDIGNTLATLKVDNNDASDFNSLNASIRFGEVDQEPLPRTSQVLGQKILSQSLAVVANTIAFTTDNVCNYLDFNITFGTGFFNQQDGGPTFARATFRYRYKLSSAGSFSSWVEFVVEAVNFAEFTVSKRSDFFPGTETVDVEIELLSTTPDPLPSGSPFAPTLDSVTEYGGDSLGYPKIALLEIDALLTSEFNSSTPKGVTVEVEGRLVPIWNGSTLTTAYSENPAWIVLDLILDPIFGLGAYFNQDNVNLDSFLEWANYCDEVVEGEARHVFGDTFVGGGNIWSTILGIADTASAAPRFSNGKIEIVLNNERNPIMLITQAAIKEGSFSQSYRKRQDIVDAIKVNFINEDTGFERDAVEVRADTPTFGGSYEIQTIGKIGITRRSEAGRAAKFELNRSQLINRSITFTCGLEAFKLLPGDIFDLAHDVLGYGQSGRTQEDSVNRSSIVLDRDVVILAGDKLALLNIEYDQYETIDIDAGDIGSHSKGDTINVITDFSFDIKACSQYSIGNPPAKPYEVERISLNKSFEVVIQANEYIAGIFDTTNDVESVTYTKIPPSGVIPADVINLQADSVTRRRPDGIFSTFDISWAYPDIAIDSGIPDPHKIEVHIRPNGFEFWQLLGTVDFAATTFTVSMELIPGTNYDIAVVPVSIRGNKKNPNQTSFITQTFEGNQLAPLAPSNLVLTDQTSNIRLDWDPATDEANIEFYEVRYGWDWHTGIVVYQGLIPSTTFDGWCLDGIARFPDSETGSGVRVTNRFWVRSKNFGGRFSRDAAYGEITMNPEGVLVYQRNLRDDIFTSIFKTSMVSDTTIVSPIPFTFLTYGDPTIRIIDGVSSTTMRQRTVNAGEVFDTGSTNPKTVRVHVTSQGIDRLKEWSDPGDWFTDEDDSGGRRSWGGLLNESTDLGSIRIYMAWSNDLITNYTPFVEVSKVTNNSFRYFKIEVHLDTGSLDRGLGILDIQLTAEET